MRSGTRHEALSTDNGMHSPHRARAGDRSTIAGVRARRVPTDYSPSGTRDGSWASSPGVRRSMRSNRRTDTGPERDLRSALHAAGLRFRKDYRVDLPDGRVCVDVAFPGRRLAVFVDGCFWHRCPDHATEPKINQEFWDRKLRRNVERDRQVDASLSAAGWTVLRFWEHESPAAAAKRVHRVIDARDEAA